MTILLSTLAVAFAAFCVWLTVRVINSRGKVGWKSWGIAALVLPLMVYIGAYLAMVRPLPIGFGNHILTLHTVHWGPFGERARFFEGRFLTFFSPLIELDRKLRPGTWPPPREIHPGMPKSVWPSSD